MANYIEDRIQPIEDTPLPILTYPECRSWNMIIGWWLGAWAKEKWGNAWYHVRLAPHTINYLSCHCNKCGFEYKQPVIGKPVQYENLPGII